MSATNGSRTAEAESRRPAVLTPDAVVEKMAEELVCVLCGSTFVDPRMLSCQHCFCLRCLFSQALHDRGSHLTLTCAFRCKTLTTTTGDIRTIPRNPIITSLSVLVRRQQMVELEEKHRQLQRQQEQQQGITSEDLVGSAQTEVTSSGGEGAQKSGVVMAGDEFLECEWCSESSPSCQVCKHCVSRVCAECNGHFGDHYFLCVSQHEAPDARKGFVHRTTKVHDTSAISPTGEHGEHGHGNTGTSQAVSRERDEEEEDTDGGISRFPFLLTETDARARLHGKLEELLSMTASASETAAFSRERRLRQQSRRSPAASPSPESGGAVSSSGDSSTGAAMTWADIDIEEVLPVRLAVPLWSVDCEQAATGFTSTLLVASNVTLGDVTLSVDDRHWEKDDLGTEALLLLSNMLRITQRATKAVNQASMRMGELHDELASMARREMMEKNRGFQLVASHMAITARMLTHVTRNCLLPHVVRARFVEGFMGDMVSNRYTQRIQHCSVTERDPLRDRYRSFLKTEILLCKRLDKALVGLDAVCFGAETILKQITTRLATLLSREDGIVSSASRSPNAFTQRGANGDVMATAMKKCPAVRTQLKRGSVGLEHTGSTGDKGTESGRGPLLKSLPADLSTAGATADPIHDPYADFTFGGQMDERRDAMESTTAEFTAVIQDFIKARHWTWTYMNTTMRSCGLSDDVRTAILRMEEGIQTITDSFFTQLIKASKWLDLWEHHALHEDGQHSGMWNGKAFAEAFLAAHLTEDQSGSPCSSGNRDPASESLADAQPIAETDSEGAENSGYFAVTYTLSQVTPALENLRTLRSHLQDMEMATRRVNMRGYDTQSQLLEMMSSLLRPTMVHQYTVINAARTELNYWQVCMLKRFHEFDWPFQDTFSAVWEQPLRVTEETLKCVGSMSPDELMALSGDDNRSSSQMSGDFAFLRLDAMRRACHLAVAGRLGQQLVDAAHGVNSLSHHGAASEQNQTTTPGDAQDDDHSLQRGTLAAATTPSLFPQSQPSSPPTTSQQLPPVTGIRSGEDGDSAVPFQLPDAERPHTVEGGAYEATSGNTHSSSSVSDITSADDHADGAGEVTLSHDGDAAPSVSRRQSRVSPRGRTPVSCTDIDAGHSSPDEQKEFKAIEARMACQVVTTFLEHVFAADDAPTPVGRVITGDPGEASAATARARASAYFDEYYKFECDSAVASCAGERLLPFYIGLYRYKHGDVRLFVVDAQTGHVWTESPQAGDDEDGAPRRAAVGGTHILLFILANVAAKYFFGTSMVTMFSLS